MKKILIALLVICLLVGGVIGGVTYFSKQRQDAKVVEVVPVHYVAQSEYYGDTISTYGIISSNYTQSVYLSDDMILDNILVEEGQQVKPGTALLQYDSTKFEIDLETARHAISLLDFEIEQTQKELVKWQNTKPYTPPVEPPYEPWFPEDPGPEEPPVEEPEPSEWLCYTLTPDSKPYKGSGTEEDPFVFLCAPGCEITPAFLQYVLGLSNPELPSEPSSENPTPSTDEPGSTPEEPSSESTSPTEPETTPESSSAPEETTAGSGDGLVMEENSRHYNAAEENGFIWPGTDGIVVILEIREGNQTYGTFLYGWQVNGETGMITLLRPEDMDEEIDSDPDIEPTGTSSKDGIQITSLLSGGITTADLTTYDSNSYYTQEEINQGIKDCNEKLVNLNFQRSQADLSLTAAEADLKKATVTAALNGTVKDVLTQEESVAQNKPLFQIYGGDGIFITGQIAENLIPDYEAGNLHIIGLDWQSGMHYNIDIVEVSPYPLKDNYYMGMGNPNSTYYEFTGAIQNPEGLQAGTFLDMTITIGSEEETSSSLFLEQMYILQENGNYYVFKDVNGALQKTKVTITGRVIYGSNYEITDGLTMDDYIAFPYGDAKDGVKTNREDNGDIDTGTGDDGVIDLPIIIE